MHYIPKFMDTTNDATATQPAAPNPKITKGCKSNYCIGKRNKRRHIIVDITHGLVLVLSLALIVYISYDTFKSIPFLENHHYMTFQFWVCMVFLADFFIQLTMAVDKKTYLKTRWFFFLISIPYLNIINQFNINFSSEVVFYIRFIPLIRGAYSLAMVMGYISKNRAYSLMSQYVALLLALIYILSLIFYYEEHGVNPDVKSFWDALYFSAMNCSTVGCYFCAITPIGKIISVILPTAGMLILPLFTAVVVNKVKSYDESRKQEKLIFEEKMQQEASN